MRAFLVREVTDERKRGGTGERSAERAERRERESREVSE